MTTKIAVIGTTAWGVTLATVLSRRDMKINLWARNEEEAARVRSSYFPKSKLPENFVLPPSINVTSDMDKAMDDVTAVVMAVPSQSMRDNIRRVAPYLGRRTLIVSAAKGLELTSGKLMSQVIADEVKKPYVDNICVLSGPNLAWEIIAGLPAVTVIAAEKESRSRRAAKLFTVPNFCAYTNTDVVGVELGGALKNIIALGAGMVDGLGYGDNTKAALITRGLTEITALGTAMGAANPLTFSGLAGLGDLVATCSSKLSRNHYVGLELTKGRSLKDITQGMAGVAEGITTTLVAYNLAQKLDLAMPITERIYGVLYLGEDPHAAALDLMAASAAHELAGRKWNLFSFFRRKKRQPTTLTF